MGLNFDFTSSYGQTLLSEEEKLGLRYSHVTTNAELNELEQTNIQAAILWTAKQKLAPCEILTEDFLKKLHRKMYGDTWKWAGKYRRTDKNIGVQWTTIPMALKQLTDDAKFWIDNETYSPIEIAIRFKHRIVAIHCFPNGNGRHSRLIADVLLSVGYQIRPLSWGASSRLPHPEIRSDYITALRKADRGELEDLIAFALS